MPTRHAEILGRRNPRTAARREILRRPGECVLHGRCPVAAQISRRRQSRDPCRVCPGRRPSAAASFTAAPRRFRGAPTGMWFLCEMRRWGLDRMRASIFATAGRASLSAGTLSRGARRLGRTHSGQGLETGRRPRRRRGAIEARAAPDPRCRPIGFCDGRVFDPDW